MNDITVVEQIWMSHL